MNNCATNYISFILKKNPTHIYNKNYPYMQNNIKGLYAVTTSLLMYAEY